MPCYRTAKGIPTSSEISLSFLGNGDKKSSLPGLFAPGSPCPRGSPSSSQASRKACLHLLSSFLISNFLFNPLLPDLFCSVERL
ncbi:hypothetical protein VULLAG_LOCUS19897 [Vulpes lagopus]